MKVLMSYLIFKRRYLRKNGSWFFRPFFGFLSTWKSIHDDFLGETEFKNIDDVNKIEVDTNVIVFGTIISFPPGVEWYYNSCKDCTKKVTVLYFISDDDDGLDLSEGNQTIRCINDACNEKGVSVVPRLKLQIRIQDGTSIASLTLLDHVARKLIGKSAQELVDKFVDGETDNLLLEEISNLVGKKIAFKIEISYFNVKHNYKSFTVKRFSEDPAIISQLESKLGIEHVNISNSVNTTSGDFESTEIVDLKDDTPMSLIGSSTGSISVAAKNVENLRVHSDLKRNLVDSYDHDESSTKAPLGCSEDFNTYSKDKRKTRKNTAYSKDSISVTIDYETSVSMMDTSVSTVDSSARGMGLRNKRPGKLKTPIEPKRTLAKEFDCDDSGSKDPLTIKEGPKSLLIPKKEK